MVDSPVNSPFLRGRQAVACTVFLGRLAASVAWAGQDVVRPCAGRFQVSSPEPDLDSPWAAVERGPLAAQRPLQAPPLPDVPQVSRPLKQSVAQRDALESADLPSLVDVWV